MKIAVLDSTAVVSSGPGSPAYFSRFVIQRLRQQGHEVTVAPGFDENLCREADLVWTEWANEDAYTAAASGICKRLVVRMRGFDAHGPLDKLEWSNVQQLVFESHFLKDLVETRLPGLRGFRTCVLTSGIDLTKTEFVERLEKPKPPVVALAARATNDKGLQLVWEWARQRPEIQIHVALALPETSPRLVTYLASNIPNNIHHWESVEDVPKWLNEIAATHILSASIWETLGYTIVEGMSVGCRPLIHRAPGTAVNWPAEHLWTSFDDLDKLVYEKINSVSYRSYAEGYFDEEKLSQKFIDLVTSLSERPAKTHRASGVAELSVQAAQAIAAEDMPRADAIVTKLRAHTRRFDGVDDIRAGMAFNLACTYYNAGSFEQAEVWAARSLLDIMRPEALCLLGEAAVMRADFENAVRWYRAACAIEDVPSRYAAPGVSGGRQERLAELEQELRPALLPAAPPPRYLIVVATRNSEKWTRQCLTSIQNQTRPFLCVVIDDASTDNTREVMEVFANDNRFALVSNTERKWSIRNIVESIQRFGQSGDVVVIIDGDDWLASPEALARLDKAYAAGAWATHGNFTSASGKPSWMPAYPQYVIRANRFRHYPWSVSHPKTFKKQLFDKIKLDAFQHDGEWLKITGDVALMLPILEMSAERTVHISDTLYVYNDMNSESDHIQASAEQVRVRDVIFDKTPYARLETL